MRRIILPVSALLAGLLLLLFFREGEKSRQAPTIEPPTSETNEQRAEAPLSAEEKAAALDRMSLVAEKLSSASPEESQPSDSEVPRCRVFGRLTDESGFGLPEVGVSLLPVHEPWIAPEIYPGRIDGFATKSRADGYFEFETPLPTSDWVRLLVHPGPFHFSLERHFGDGNGRGSRYLHQGDNDLGALVLKEAGIVKGRILDEQGNALAQATVVSKNDRDESVQVGTEEDGTFRLERVPVGSQRVGVRAQGYVSKTVEGVEVRVGQVTGLMDIRVESAPYIEGSVRGEDGEILTRGLIRCVPAKGGGGTAGWLSEDGKFRVYLTVAEPVTLSAHCSGYEAYFSEEIFQPGERDISIVLKQLLTTTFQVRDAATREPIESFDLKIFVARSERDRYGHRVDAVPDEFTEHKDGIQVLPASPPYEDYTIAAQGYAPQRGRVEFDLNAEGREQTILMHPGGTLTGRFVSDGVSLPYHNVSLAADRYPVVPGVTKGEDDPHSRNWAIDVDPFAGARRKFRGDDEGRFRIESIAPGTYELLFDAALTAPTKVEGIVVQAGKVTDLGDVAAAQPSSIRGRIQLGNAMPLNGLDIGLGRGKRGKYQLDEDSLRATDKSGSFQFPKLEEGHYWLWVLPKTGVLVKGPPLEVTLAVGETREVELDLTHREPAHLEVVVHSEGISPKGWEIVIENKEDSRFHFRVGETDVEGRCVGEAPESQDAVILVRGHKGFTIGRSEPQHLQRGVQSRVELEFEPGRLFITVPARLEDTKTKFGHIQGFSLSIGPADSPTFAAGARLSRADLNEETGEPRFDLGCLAPGDYRLKVRNDELLYEGRVTVDSGKTAICRLTE